MALFQAGVSVTRPSLRRADRYFAFLRTYPSFPKLPGITLAPSARFPALGTTRLFPRVFFGARGGLLRHWNYQDVA